MTVPRFTRMSVPTHPTDLEPFRTADGSLTLRSEQWNENYHSSHGAVQESTHVFIKAGLEHVGKTHVQVLEVGLGTGLNLLLTWVRCLEGKLTVDYTALEPFPVAQARLEQLAHCQDLAWPGLHEPFIERMVATTEDWQDPMGGLRFRKRSAGVREMHAVEEFDLIYFDAFGPRVQPDMWTRDIFELMYAALRPAGLLVTYCAKGEVRRLMEQVGFKVERLDGPPGKREMLRATKG